MTLRDKKNFTLSSPRRALSVLAVVASMIEWSGPMAFHAYATELQRSIKFERVVSHAIAFNGEVEQDPSQDLVLSSPETLVPYGFREVSQYEEDLPADVDRRLGQTIADEMSVEESTYAHSDDLGPDTLEPEHNTMVVYEDVSLEILDSSRDQFRNMLRLGDEGIRFDPRLVVSLTSDPKVIEPIREWGSEPLNAFSSKRFQAGRVYTVLGGRIVEFLPDTPLSAGQIVSKSSSPFAMQILPEEKHYGLSDGVVNGESKTDLSNSTSPVLDAGRVLGQSSASYLSGSISSGISDSRHQGAYLKGRIESPQGVDNGGLILRIAGTGVQAKPDKKGFFELGPLSAGSSFHLLIFDDNGRLNRRLVPVHLGLSDPDSHVLMIRSEDVYVLAQSFGKAHAATDAGFCGSVILPSPDIFGSAQVMLFDALGQRYPMGFYGPQGFPAVGEKISQDGRVCGFGLKPGSYRLLVTAQGLRRSFDLDLRSTIFENSRVFDTLPTRYLKVSGNIPVDASLHQSLVNEDGLAVLPLSHPLDDFWIDGGDGQEQSVVWTPVTDYLLSSDRAYASVGVQSDSELQYFPASEELVAVREETSGSFELIGRSDISAASDKNQALVVHWLGRDTARRLRAKLDLADLDKEFVFLAEIDTAKLMTSQGPYEIRVSDVWSGQPTGRIVRLSRPDARILRFAGGELEPGIYAVSVYSADRRLVYTSVLRSEPSSSQVLTNRR